MSGKSSPEFQWTDDEIQLLLEATQNLKVEEDYKILSQTNYKFTFWCFNIQLFRFIRNFHFFIKRFTKPSLKTFH